MKHGTCWQAHNHLGVVSQETNSPDQIHGDKLKVTKDDRSTCQNEANSSRVGSWPNLILLFPILRKVHKFKSNQDNVYTWPHQNIHTA